MKIAKIRHLQWSLLTFSSLLVFGFISRVNAAGTTYYVSSSGGNDSNSGTAATQAWRSLAKVNSIAFQPGDQILFKSGDTFTGGLAPQGSGASGQPVVVDTYGSGPKPHLDGAGKVNAVVKLQNQQYWTVQNLELTNDAGTDTSERWGVDIVGNNAGTLHGIHVNNLTIHDVRGWADWNTMPFDTASAIGVNIYGGGQDKITKFDDVLIKNNTIYNIYGGGITLYSAYNVSPNSANPDANRWSSHVVIKNNWLNYTNGLVLNGADGPVIDRNVVYNSHKSPYAINVTCNVGLFFTYVRNALVQHNEVAHSGNSCDSEGFDNDIGTQGTNIWQYNYSHDNPGGFFMVTEGSDNAQIIIRFNLSQNDGIGSQVKLGSGHVSFYNNTIYNSSDRTIVSGQPGGGGYFYATATLTNNIFMGKPGIYDLFEPQFTYDSNIFYQDAGVASDSHKSSLDPLFVNPGSGGDGIGTVSGYKLQSDSPALNTGAIIPNNGGKDYFGNSLPANTADRGF